MDDIEYIKLHIDDYAEEEGWVDSYGVEYSMDRKVLLSMREIDSSLTSYEIRKGTLAVASWIFYDSDFCGDIYIPKTVQYIDGGAFTHSGIQNVICSSDWYYIEEGLIIDSQSHFIVSAFNTNCVLELPKDIQGIYHNAFTNNYSLKELIINNENFTIEEDAFSDCEGLRSFQIKSKYLTIGEHAFDVVISLKRVDIASENLSIGKHAFRYCHKLEHVRISGDLQLLNIFKDCHSLQYLDLPSSIIEISDYCFSECKKLKSFILPENVQTIGKAAFENCESLTNIHFNNHLERINRRAFKNCTSIKYLILPDTLEAIEEFAFENCHNIRYLILRGPTNNIGSSAFWGCYGIHYILLISPTYELINNRSFEYIDTKKIIINQNNLPAQLGWMQHDVKGYIVFMDFSIEDILNDIGAFFNNLDINIGFSIYDSY